MRQRLAGTLASVGVAAASLMLAASASAAAASTTLPGTAAPAASSTPALGEVSGGKRISFEVDLALSDPTGAAAFAKAVSSPGSSSYKQYLTPAQWEARFSPTSATVARVEAFLHMAGFSVGAVSADRMTIDASGSATRIERAFGTTLSYHLVQGKKLIVNDTALSVPSSLGASIVGVAGLTQTLAEPATISVTRSTVAAGAKGVAAGRTKVPGVKPPPGSNVAQPCSSYWGQLTATGFSAVPGFSANPPYDVCGYTPPQLRGAYGLTSSDNGTGVTVAIVDAYASPTLYQDAEEYAQLNDPSNPLQQSQFSELVAKKFDDGKECGGQNGWWEEQTLDVESVHATAPGANILFAGAANCVGGLNNTIQQIVDGHLADVITNSYGDPSGDLTDGQGDRTATDDLLQMAAGTGVSVLFSTGDEGDNYSATGVTAPSYPASSPWATAVGGSSLEIGSSNQRLAEYGWSTARYVYCTADAHALGFCKKKELNTWITLGSAPGSDPYAYGSGGGTSYSYIQPYYQAGVVPTSLSELRGTTAMRVVPDISMDGDPFTGMLVGETQTYPDGVHYGEYEIGGTSLASPLLAGTIARADETAGGSLGFVNPGLYSLSGKSSAIDDIVSPSSPMDTITPYDLNGQDATGGVLYLAAGIDDQGNETYCGPNAKGKTKCVAQPISLATTPGYDNMTGLGSPGAGFVTALAAH
jgi:subtilase family serine protease